MRTRSVTGPSRASLQRQQVFARDDVFHPGRCTGQLDHLPGVVLVQRHAHVVAAERLGDGQ